MQCYVFLLVMDSRASDNNSKATLQVYCRGGGMAHYGVIMSGRVARLRNVRKKILPYFCLFVNTRTSCCSACAWGSRWPPLAAKAIDGHSEPQSMLRRSIILLLDMCPFYKCPANALRTIKLAAVVVMIGICLAVAWQPCATPKAASSHRRTSTGPVAGER